MKRKEREISVLLKGARTRKKLKPERTHSEQVKGIGEKN